jgi:hypothetical protein
MPLLDATSFENAYPQYRCWCVLQLANKEPVNSCATCISHTISHGTTQLRINLCLVKEIQAERVYLQRHESTGKNSSRKDADSCLCKCNEGKGLKFIENFVGETTLKS